MKKPRLQHTPKPTNSTRPSVAFSSAIQDTNTAYALSSSVPSTRVGPCLNQKSVLRSDQNATLWATNRVENEPARLLRRAGLVEQGGTALQQTRGGTSAWGQSGGRPQWSTTYPRSPEAEHRIAHTQAGHAHIRVLRRPHGAEQRNPSTTYP